MTDKEQITCDCKYCMENPTCYKELLEEQLARKTQECEESKKLKEELKHYKTNADFLIFKLQEIWGRKIAEEQGDCKNIDYSKPITKEIYMRLSEIEATLKDVAFAQSVEMGKTKPLGETGSPRSYRNWEKKQRMLLEREFLKKEG